MTTRATLALLKPDAKVDAEEVAVGWADVLSQQAQLQRILGTSSLSAPKYLSILLSKSFGDENNTQTRVDHGQFGPGSGTAGKLPSGSSLYVRAIRDGGFSLYAQSGEEAQSGYAVGGYAPPLVLPDTMNARSAGDQVDSYVQEHAGRVAGSDMVLGGWHNTEDHTVVIEPSRIFSDREAAVSEGQLRNQISIYDISSGNEISTQGTGQYASKAAKPVISSDIDGTLTLSWTDGVPKVSTEQEALEVAPDYAGIAAINAIYDAGYTVHLRSSRDPGLQAATESWVKHWRVRCEDVEVGTHSKHKLRDATDGPIIFIDDNPKYASHLPNDHATLYLLRRPYTDDKDTSGAKIIDTWQELLDKLGVTVKDIPQLNEPLDIADEVIHGKSFGDAGNSQGRDEHGEFTVGSQAKNTDAAALAAGMTRQDQIASGTGTIMLPNGHMYTGAYTHGDIASNLGYGAGGHAIMASDAMMQDGIVRIRGEGSQVVAEIASPMTSAQVSSMRDAVGDYAMRANALGASPQFSVEVWDEQHVGDDGKYVTFGADANSEMALGDALRAANVLAGMQPAAAKAMVVAIFKGSALAAAGICVVAQNTGRILMLQRSLKDDQKQAAGRWEFPGGRLDPGETAWQAAVREWQEETGNVLPDGHTVSVFNSADGIYRAFIYVIPRESMIDINPDRDAMEVKDPDHPRAQQTEVMAWWKVKDAKKSDHALRDEFEDFDWSLVKDAVKEYAQKMMELDKGFGDPGSTQGRDEHGEFTQGANDITTTLKPSALSQAEAAWRERIGSKTGRAVDTYKTNLSWGINTDLRKDQISKTDQFTIDGMDRAIAAGPILSQDSTVYRSLWAPTDASSPYSSETANFLDQLQPGSIFQDKGFVSTSSAPGMARDYGGVHIAISVPAGTRFAIGQSGETSRQGTEIILARGASFRVDVMSIRSSGSELKGSIQATYLGSRK